jgi:UDP-N-acetylmuramate dehydrogenase
MLEPQQNVDLSSHSTMRLGGKAAYLAVVHSEEELLEAIAFAKQQGLRLKIIGSGSNIVWSGDFDGMILVNAIEGFALDGTTVTIGAGENWDAVVHRTVQAGLSGIECLSLIPGTTGATPVQNVGAYGAEIADTLVSIRAYDRQKDAFVSLQKADCGFGYRRSRFNQEDRDRFCITQITLQLRNTPPQGPFYKTLEEALQAQGISKPTALVIRNTVIAIRQSKLPDPRTIPNCGSFFKNPILSLERYEALKQEYPDVPGWQTGEHMKISAAWLIEQAGYKGYVDEQTGMGIYKDHALVVINISATQIEDLHNFTQKLVDAVRKKFGLTLEQEPELV